MSKVKQQMLTAVLTLCVSLLLTGLTAAQTTQFAYQGKLTDTGNLANGNYDFQFRLFDTGTVGTGTQLGTTVTLSSVPVSNGTFNVALDFGACVSCFNGANRFLEIAVKPTSGSTFTTLAPRQPVNSTPYAIKSQNAVNAMTADGLSVACVNCITSSQIQSVNGSAVTGTIPVASVPAGSANYIQNGTNQQATSNFNISGNGTADAFNATTQYNLGGQRLLSAAGSNNLFVGFSAGTNNTTGNANAFFGSGAGNANTTGIRNAFFGNGAGGANTTGGANAFFGWQAGLNTTIGSVNTFFGSNAGQSNLTGSDNTFIGFGADFASTNPTGSSNTLLGALTKVNSGLSNATAIGAGTTVTSSNTIVLGRSFTDNVIVGNQLTVQVIPLQASSASVCFNAVGDILQCGASSLRWKRNIQPFRSGLDIIRRLRPINFIWREDGRADFGLGAEDVAKVAPNLVFTNKAGEVEGVKYEKLNLLLINAVKEQQQQIEAQQRQIKHQQREITQQQEEMAAIKKLLCRSKPQADLCRAKPLK